MIRVVKPGVLPQERLYDGTCSYCKAILEAAREDLQEVTAGGEEAHQARCPTCKTVVTFYPQPEKKRKARWEEARSLDTCPYRD